MHNFCIKRKNADALEKAVKRDSTLFHLNLGTSNNNLPAEHKQILISMKNGNVSDPSNCPTLTWSRRNVQGLSELYSTHQVLPSFLVNGQQCCTLKVYNKTI